MVGLEDGNNFMKLLISLLWMICLPAFAWNVTDRNSDTNRFATNGLSFTINPNGMMGRASYNPQYLFNTAKSLSGSTTFRLMTFGDSRASGASGGKILGLLPAFEGVTGQRSGGLTENFPLFYHTGGTVVGPNSTWWQNYALITNGGVGGKITLLAATNNGPQNLSTAVWCDSLSVTWLRSNALGTLTIFISTNGGTYGQVAQFSTAGTFGAVVTNFSMPLNYYTAIISNSVGTCYVITDGMWNQNQIGVSFIDNSVSGAELTNFTQLSTAITYPIITNWNPTLCLVEVLDPPADIPTGVDQFEAMLLANSVTNSDVVYVGTISQATNGNPLINIQNQIPINSNMLAKAVQYGRPYYDGTFITYEQATALGWSANDGTHLNTAGGVFTGYRMFQDLCRSALVNPPLFGNNVSKTAASNIVTSVITPSTGTTGVVTMAGWTVGVAHTSYRTTDFVTNTVNTTFPDSQMIITNLLAGHTYNITFHVVWVGGSAVPGFQWGISLPSLTSPIGSAIFRKGTGGAAMLGSQGAYGGYNTSGSVIDSQTALSVGFFESDFTVRPSANGSAIFYWSQVTSSGTSITLFAGSYIRAEMLD